MEPNKKISPHFFFISIGLLIALIASVTAFINLVFGIFDHTFPDILTDSYRYGYNSYQFEGMRSALALLFIVFPIYVVLNRLWVRSIKKGLSHWDTILYRWVTYFILFLTSITIITDLVTLVRYFVSGEITTRFLLKVVVVLIVASIAGYYYISELRQTKVHTKLLGTLASILVVASIVSGFYVMGGPGSQRSLRLDQRRVEDLQSIQWQIINYWQQKERLPKDLSEFNDPISSYITPRDPEFEKGKQYEYRPISDTTFELCATFTLPMPKGWAPNGGGIVHPMRDMATSMPMTYPQGGSNENWSHDVGRTCFERTIDPQMYPPFSKSKLLQ